MSSENQTYTLQNRLWFIIVLLIHSTSQLDMYQIHRKQQIFRSKSSTKCLYHLTNALVDLLCHCLANFYSTRDSKIHYIHICHNYLVLITDFKGQHGGQYFRSRFLDSQRQLLNTNCTLRELVLITPFSLIGVILSSFRPKIWIPRIQNDQKNGLICFIWYTQTKVMSNS